MTNEVAAGCCDQADTRDAPASDMNATCGLDRLSCNGAGLLQCLREAIPPEVALAGGGIDVGVRTALASGTPQVRTMLDQRRQAFAASHRFAAAALQGLGITSDASALWKAQTSPWPSGVVGSISHSGAFCAAAAAHQSSFAALGLDIQGATPLPGALLTLVCRPPEWHDRAALERATGFDLPKLIFVIKKAVFKAYYPSMRSILEFTDIEIGLDASHATFEARLHHPSRPVTQGSRILEGRFGGSGPMVFAFAWLDA